MKYYEKWEQQVSQYFHNRYPALLISSQLLRRYNMGQVDVCWFSSEGVVVAECKSGASILNFQQKARLRHSLYFVGCLFSQKGKLIQIQSREEFANLSPSAYPFKVSKIMELT